MECAKLVSLISRQIWQVNKEKTEFPPPLPFAPPAPSAGPPQAQPVTSGHDGIFWAPTSFTRKVLPWEMTSQSLLMCKSSEAALLTFWDKDTCVCVYEAGEEKEVLE